MKFVNVFGDTSRTFLHDDQGQLTGWQEYANTTPNCVWDAENGQSCTYGSRQLLAQATYGWDKAGNPTHGGAIGSRLRIGPASLNLFAHLINPTTMDDATVGPQQYRSVAQPDPEYISPMDPIYRQGPPPGSTYVNGPR